MASAHQVGEDHLYRRLATKIVKQIDAAVLRPGERIPAVRKMSVQEGVSLSTVMQAYMLLESRGFVEARPQSGFYVRLRREKLPPEPKTSAPSPSVTKVGVTGLLAKGHAAMLDRSYVPFGAALPNPTLLPTAKLNRISAALSRRVARATDTYSLPPGNAELRRQLAKRSMDWGGVLTADEFVMTSGATEAMSLCLRAVTKFGDTIAVESSLSTKRNCT